MLFTQRKRIVFRLLYSPKRIFSILFAFYVCLLSSCDSKSVYKYRKYHIAVSEQEVIIIEGYYASKKSQMISIQKENEQWKIKQKEDVTQILEAPIDSIVLNDDWLVLDSDSRSNAVVIFKKHQQQWQFHCKIRGSSDDFGHHSLSLSDDLLLVGDFAFDNNGAIFCYDLTSNPPLLKQTLYPPKNNRGGEFDIGFGTRIVASNRWLLVCDSGVPFTQEEIKRFNITDRSGTWINGKEIPVQRPSILVYEKEQDGKWVFRQDLFYLFPHPKNGILRSDEGDIVRFGESSIDENTISIVNDKIFLYDHKKYYVFALNKDSWRYQYCTESPFKIWIEQRNPRSNYIYHLECVIFDSAYSGYLAYDNTVTLYMTKNISNWVPVNQFHFETRPDNDILGNESYGPSIIIHKNVIVAYSYWYLDVRRKRNDTPISTGNVTIYEISPDQKVHDVFQIEAFDNGALVL